MVSKLEVCVSITTSPFSSLSPSPQRILDSSMHANSALWGLSSSEQTLTPGDTMRHWGIGVNWALS